jgi:carboxylate-amine ligase
LPLIHPKKILGECEERLGGLIKPELLKSQIEVATGVCKSISGGREELTRLRGTVAEVANKYGLAAIAASTHPFPNGRARTT